MLFAGRANFWEFLLMLLHVVVNVVDVCYVSIFTSWMFWQCLWWHSCILDSFSKQVRIWRKRPSVHTATVQWTLLYPYISEKEERDTLLLAREPMLFLLMLCIYFHAMNVLTVLLMTFLQFFKAGAHLMQETKCTWQQYSENSKGSHP